MQMGKRKIWGPGARIVGLAAALGASALACNPAQAQLFGWLGYGYAASEPDEPMPPGAIRRNLVRQGYQLNRPLRRNGAVVLADVTDPRGQPMRLIVSPMDGSILERFVLAPSRGSYAYSERSMGYPDQPSSIMPNEPRNPSALPPAVLLTPPEKASRHPGKPKIARAPVPDGTTRNPRAALPADQPAAPPLVGPAVAPVPLREAPADVAGSAPAPAAPKPASAPPKTDGPGFANGVPINPLD